VAIVLVAPSDPDLRKADWRGVADELGRADRQPGVLAGGSDRAGPLLRYLEGPRDLKGAGFVNAREIVVLGFDPPSDGSECLTGIACNVPERAVEEVDLPPGFEEVDRARVHLFDVARYQAPTSRRVSGARLAAQEPAGDPLGPFFQAATSD
jgi:hypothetical protein